jgi:hypothetical protein
MTIFNGKRLNNSVRPERGRYGCGSAIFYATYGQNGGCGGGAGGGTIAHAVIACFLSDTAAAMLALRCC